MGLTAADVEAQSIVVEVAPPDAVQLPDLPQASCAPSKSVSFDVSVEEKRRAHLGAMGVKRSGRPEEHGLEDLSAIVYEDRATLDHLPDLLHHLLGKAEVGPEDETPPLHPEFAPFSLHTVELPGDTPQYSKNSPFSLVTVDLPCRELEEVTGSQDSRTDAELGVAHWGPWQGDLDSRLASVEDARFILDIVDLSCLKNAPPCPGASSFVLETVDLPARDEPTYEDEATGPADLPQAVLAPIYLAAH